MRTLKTVLFAVAVSACGGADQITDQQRVDQSLEVAAHVRDAVELLGLLPDFTCGESRSTVLGRAVSGVSVEVSCVTVTTEDDRVRLHFGDACRAQGHVVKGDAIVKVTGGDDRLEIEAELQGLVVDGRVLTGRAGYGTCGDEKRYWGAAKGTLEDGTSYSVDVRVGVQKGLPIIGNTTLILDGTAELTRATGEVDGVTITALEYEMGSFAPKRGSIEVRPNEGGTVLMTFTNELWKLGRVKVSHEGGEPVIVAIVQ